MKNLSPIKKILLACITLNVVAVGFYAFVLWSIQAKNEKVVEVLGQVNEDMKKDESLRAVKISLEENKDFISQIDSFFVPEDGVANFIASLESLGRASSVELSIASVEIQPNSAKNDFKEGLNIRIETSGSWFNTFYLLSVIENLPYKIDINQVSLTLSNATDKILFSGLGPRTKTSGEYWKGSFDITVLKLK